MDGQRSVPLSVRNVSKSFSGVQVLHDVSVQFLAGEVHALLGENGAGKSTLVKIISGVIAADAGEIKDETTGGDVDVAMVFQELSVVPELSVLDNVILGIRDKSGSALRRRDYMPRVRDALDRAGLQDVALDTPVEVLPLAKRQLLEIARGLVADAKVLILDEPTATLSDVEIERVHQVVRSLTGQGHAIVYITHRLGEVFALADRLTVMRAGRVIETGPVQDYTQDALVTAMLGEDHQAGTRWPVNGQLPSTAQRRTLEASSLTAEPLFRDVSFTAKAGEVLAFFGQIGSGADEVIRALVGLNPDVKGSLRLDGSEITSVDRPRTQKEGIAYVSSDRVLEGVFLSSSVKVNISSGCLDRVSTASVLSAGREQDLARGISQQVAFDPRRINVPVGSLSGGNQQKIAIGRALATEPKVLVLNEPTRGVDIGARSEIYRAIRELASDNVVVIVYSSDIVELRELTDRVITMFRGRMIGDHMIEDVKDTEMLAEILNGNQNGVAA
jgi:ribose transport system ATP-binding protein